MTLFATRPRSRKTGPGQYYEDIYGTRNADEVFDRHPDSCEDETSSDEVVPKSKSSGFFQKYSSQIHNRPSPERQGRGGSSNSTLSGSNTTTTTNEHHDIGYQIRPKINPKRSVKATASKKLTPKKGGIFGTLPSSANSNMNNPVTPTKKATLGPYPTPTSTLQQRNDMMADAFMSGGLGELTADDLDFGTLEEGDSGAGDPFVNGNFSEVGVDASLGNHVSVATNPQVWISGLIENGPVILSIENGAASSNGDGSIEEAAPVPDKKRKREVEAVYDAGSSIGAKVPSAVDDDVGYHADEEETDGLDQWRAGGQYKAGAVVKAIREEKEPEVRIPTRGRYTTRNGERMAKERQEAERLAQRPRTRSSGKELASSKNKNKVTARSATLHRKTKKKPVAKASASKELTRPSGGRISKRGLARRTDATNTEINWKGEKTRLEPGQAFVTFPEHSVVDLDEYEKHY